MSMCEINANEIKNNNSLIIIIVLIIIINNNKWIETNRYWNGWINEWKLQWIELEMTMKWMIIVMNRNWNGFINQRKL